ncbi:HK97 family phage prohead protease [Enterobacter hormaechei]|uniref:HK97 family phage prohead protease n=1 Tax=Enterobacter hormaechei TaxID=158836 RepID=UPI000735D39A|nr:HK97 family phage prohead protease [Enterobacter hormaechei]MCI9500184.1 HK97 family phage prohead protease [Enterobacter hormaechei subsp. steigerwaltii]ELD3428703.1 HK97 family phage prohead protease [Enterobacter hormaechei]KTI34509.1 peptidase [Enterobacter hormaechei subsp. xiangfangensis]KTJ89408.1 peptidase [Enterobacter hormaechei subsp. xiangfangensis]MCG0490418.1 HK97 family phage prohead protease [Enterobacter hormaechei]
MNKELRSYSGEIRAEQRDNVTHIVGYGSVFDVLSEPMWGFREIIRPGAFDEVLGDDVRGLFNHDANFVLGRTAAATMTLTVDDRGLHYDIIAPETPTIRDLVIAPMQRGDITQSSFAFRVAPGGDNWYEDDDGVIIREITKVGRLYDVSPVTYPAYQAADSSVRSLTDWKEARARTLQAVNAKAARERELDLFNL